MKTILQKYLVNIKKTCIDFSELIKDARNKEYLLSEMFGDFTIFKVTNNTDINKAKKFLSCIENSTNVPAKTKETFNSWLNHLNSHNIKETFKISFSKIGVTFVYSSYSLLSDINSTEMRCYFVILGNMVPIHENKVLKLLELLYTNDNLNEFMDKLEYFVMKSN